MKTKKTKKSKIQKFEDITKELFQNNSTLKFIADFKSKIKKHDLNKYTQNEYFQYLLKQEIPTKNRKLKDPDLLTKITFNFMVISRSNNFIKGKSFFKEYFYPSIIKLYPDLVTYDFEYYHSKLYYLNKKFKNYDILDLKNHPYFDLHDYTSIIKLIMKYSIINDIDKISKKTKKARESYVNIGDNITFQSWVQMLRETELEGFKEKCQRNANA